MSVFNYFKRLSVQSVAACQFRLNAKLWLPPAKGSWVSLVGTDAVVRIPSKDEAGCIEVADDRRVCTRRWSWRESLGCSRYCLLPPCYQACHVPGTLIETPPLRACASLQNYFHNCLQVWMVCLYYRTQVYLRSDLWVQSGCLSDLVKTDVTLADEDPTKY